MERLVKCGILFLFSLLQESAWGEDKTRTAYKDLPDGVKDAAHLVIEENGMPSKIVHAIYQEMEWYEFYYSGKRYVVWKGDKSWWVFEQREKNGEYDKPPALLRKNPRTFDYGGKALASRKKALASFRGEVV